jgi:hypothetical protein
MMHFESSALVALGTIAFIAGMRLIYREVCGFSSRTANDVFPFLQRIDMEALYGTFHPDAEEHFRSSLSAAEFRQVQWKRIHLAIHYCNQVSNNACVFLGWTRHERKESWNAMDRDLRKTVQELRIACIQSRLSTFMIRVRLRCWLFRMALLPFAPPPSFAALAGVGSSDMISFYETVKTLAESFSLAYGDDYHQKLTSAL